VIAAQLFTSLARQGFTLAAEGNGIRISPASRLTDALRQDIREHKAELLAILLAPAAPLPSPRLAQPSSEVEDPWRYWRGVTWPKSCLESERLFGQPHARLFPLVPCGNYPDAPTGRVMTLNGPGRLLQVFAERAAVVLDAGLPNKMTFLHPSQVWSVAQTFPWAAPSGNGAPSEGALTTPRQQTLFEE
jgi:hypothetical protein